MSKNRYSVMLTPFKSLTAPAVSLAAALALAVLVAGCSSSTDQAENSPEPEIRGEPIIPKHELASSPPPADPVTPSGTTLPVEVPAPATPAPSETPASASNEEPAPVPAPADPDPVTQPPAEDQQKAVAAVPPAPGAEVVDGFSVVSFEQLASFNFEMPEDLISTNETKSASSDQIPPTIKALDDKPIALKGFMLPLKVESGLVTEMLIMRDQSMCCFGTVPRINEWVSVKMARKGVKPIMDQAVTIFGKLFVGEMRENGYLVGIYRMDGEKIAEPLDF